MTEGFYTIRNDNDPTKVTYKAEVKQIYISGKLIGSARAMVDERWTGFAPMVWWRENGWNTWIKDGKNEHAV